MPLVMEQWKGDEDSDGLWVQARLFLIVDEKGAWLVKESSIGGRRDSVVNEEAAKEAGQVIYLTIPLFPPIKVPPRKMVILMSVDMARRPNDRAGATETSSGRYQVKLSLCWVQRPGAVRLIDG